MLGVLVLLFAIEGLRAAKFYVDVSRSKSDLLALRDDLDISRLQESEDEVLAKQERLRDASGRLRSAKGFVDSDPLLAMASPLPWTGKQAKGLKALVRAAEEGTRTGLAATEIALAFARYERDPSKTSIQDALGFLQQQREQMTTVDQGLARLKLHQSRLDGGLIGPLDGARDDLEGAIDKLDGLVQGYQRADAILPSLLGYDGRRRYLILPQNDTELFPSGGLISSYGVATFEAGRLVSMDLEYFGTLFDRWQRTSGREYIEPPGPLKNYLKRDYAWGLGEAGWYPDFPTTGELARTFVSKGGVAPTDGVIAIDLQFISALIELLGPMEVPDYRVTITPENVSELTLELTRDENYIPGVTPGQPQKAFLSYLSQALVSRVFTAPKETWPELLRLLDQMGRERHLQLNFVDPNLQALIDEYGFDGALEQPPAGDFLMIADTSVNSTKLNLILRPRARLDMQLLTDGTARSLVSYEINNPLPDWARERDPKLVKALMLDGVYGSYVRVYANEKAVLKDARLDNKTAGVEQNELELGKRVFGRFFPVLPGATNSAQFLYETKDAVQRIGVDTYSYQLSIQKQAGTSALPLAIRVLLPKGAQLKSARLDGKAQNQGTTIFTDLRTDRVVEIVFTVS